VHISPKGEKIPSFRVNFCAGRCGTLKGMEEEGSQNSERLTPKAPKPVEFKNMIFNYPKKLILIRYTWRRTECNGTSPGAI